MESERINETRAEFEEHRRLLVNQIDGSRRKRSWNYRWRFSRRDRTVARWCSRRRHSPGPKDRRAESGGSSGQARRWPAGSHYLYAHRLQGSVGTDPALHTANDW